jgi:hypothetical protein
VRWGDRDRPGPPGCAQGVPATAGHLWTRRGRAYSVGSGVRPTGAAEQAPDTFGRGRHDERSGDDRTLGPAKADAFVLLRPQARKGRTHEDRPRPPRPGAAGPGAHAQAALQEEPSSPLIAAEGRTRRPQGAIGPETLRKRKSAKRPRAPRSDPGRRPNHPPHQPQPRSRNHKAAAEAQAARVSPAGRAGVGRFSWRDRHESRPTPLVRRELGRSLSRAGRSVSRAGRS